MESTQNKIHLYIISLNQPIIEDASTYAWLFDTWEGQKHDKKESDLAKKQFMVAHVYNRFILSKHFDWKIKPRNWVFEYNEFERPYLAPIGNKVPLNFNISHCTNCVAIVVSENCTVGVDVETVNVKIDESLIRIMFTENEIKEVETLYSENINEGYQKLWILKEAYYKRLGLGVGVDLKNIEFSLKENTVVSTTFLPYDEDLQFFQAENIKLNGEGYNIAVSAEAKTQADFLLDITFISTVEEMQTLFNIPESVL